MDEQIKKCCKCGETKPYIDFYKRKKSTDGLTSICKSCTKLYADSHKEYYKIYNKNNQEKVREQIKLWYENNKENRKEYKKTYDTKYFENPINRERNRIYQEKRRSLPGYKEKMKTYDKDKHKKNPEYTKNYMRNYNRNKYKNNIYYKMEMIIRGRFRDAIKKGIKHKSIIKLLGCSIEDFKQYLENKFLPEMTWNNHGEIWEIDHILPCSSFDLTLLEEQQKCFHYKNHQPLFKTTEVAESFGYINYIGNRDKYNSII